jgi:exodeoxyribonuclease VII small subunit
MEAQTFREAYGVLQEHAESLREQTEPNIDDLLSIVTESVAAYKVCKERIDAVERALQAALTDLGGEPGRTGGAKSDAESGEVSEPTAATRSQGRPAAKLPSSRVDEMDDDVPF